MRLTVTTTWERKPRGTAGMRCGACGDIESEAAEVWFRKLTRFWICDLCLRDVLGVAEKRMNRCVKT